MKTWIVITLLSLLGLSVFLATHLLSYREGRYYVGIASEMHRIGQSTEIFFNDHEDRQEVYLAELSRPGLSRIGPQDIVQPISRNRYQDPDYPNVIHKEYGTIADVRRELDNLGVRK